MSSLDNRPTEGRSKRKITQEIKPQLEHTVTLIPIHPKRKPSGVDTVYRFKKAEKKIGYHISFTVDRRTQFSFNLTIPQTRQLRKKLNEVLK